MTIELDWHGHSAKIQVHDQNDNQLVNIESHTAPVRFALEKGTFSKSDKTRAHLKLVYQIPATHSTCFRLGTRRIWVRCPSVQFKNFTYTQSGSGKHSKTMRTARVLSRMSALNLFLVHHLISQLCWMIRGQLVPSTLNVKSRLPSSFWAH